MKGYNTRSVWIISAEIRYLLSEQKKFQNKSKNIDEVYPSEFFHCIIFYHTESLFFVMFCGKFIIHQKVRYDIFLQKSCKVVLYNIRKG